jgi:anti-sigma regulatory factor (Ser/Thr protein kinase)
MATCNRLQDVELRLEPTPEAAYEARLAVRRCFYDSLPAVTLHDLMIVVTELVTNSVKYGPGGEIEVRIGALPEGVVRGEVRDQGGAGRPGIRESPSLEGGLGLRMVDALTRRWGVDARERTRVWFELGLADS